MSGRGGGMVSGSVVRGQAISEGRLCTLAISWNLLSGTRRQLTDHLVGRVSQVRGGMHWGLVPTRRCVPRGLARNASEEVNLKVTSAHLTSTTKLTLVQSGQAKQVHLHAQHVGLTYESREVSPMTTYILTAILTQRPRHCRG